MATSPSIEPAGRYLERRELRAASRRLTQLIVLGYGIGAILLGLGLYHYFLAFAGHTAGWKAVAVTGAALMLVTMVAPIAWTLPERLMRRFGNAIGHVLMTALLVLVYFGFFWPLGALIRRVRGSDPVYEWGSSAPSGMEGWRRKELPPDVAGASGAATGKGRLGFFSVLVFFSRRRNYFLIPALVLLISLGIVLFFLQTSALAPFIYTLF